MSQVIVASAALAFCTSGLAQAAGGGRAHAAGASLHTNHGCYVVGASVRLRGSGFAPSRSYVVSIDGVYFGQDQTDSAGSFSTSLRPGGLGAGAAQAVEQLESSDGNATVTTKFTVTRPTGARFVQTPATAHSTRLPLEVWGFSRSGRRRSVYLHYVSPAGHAARTIAIGHTSGQCGYLRTAPRPIFPLRSSTPGTWTLQLDTRRSYARHPGGPVAHIKVRVA